MIPEEGCGEPHPTEHTRVRKVKNKPKAKEPMDSEEESPQRVAQSLKDRVRTPGPTQSVMKTLRGKSVKMQRRLLLQTVATLNAKLRQQRLAVEGLQAQCEEQKRNNVTDPKNFVLQPCAHTQMSEHSQDRQAEKPKPKSAQKPKQAAAGPLDTVLPQYTKPTKEAVAKPTTDPEPAEAEAGAEPAADSESSKEYSEVPNHRVFRASEDGRHKPMSVENAEHMFGKLDDLPKEIAAALGPHLAVLGQRLERSLQGSLLDVHSNVTKLLFKLGEVQECQGKLKRTIQQMEATIANNSQQEAEPEVEDPVALAVRRVEELKQAWRDQKLADITALLPDAGVATWSKMIEMFESEARALQEPWSNVPEIAAAIREVQGGDAQDVSFCTAAASSLRERAPQSQRQGQPLPQPQAQPAAPAGQTQTQSRPHRAPRLPEPPKFSGKPSREITCTKTWWNSLVLYLSTVHGSDKFVEYMPFFLTGTAQEWAANLYQQGSDKLTEEGLRKEFLQLFGTAQRETVHEARTKLHKLEFAQEQGEAVARYVQRFRDLMRQAGEMAEIDRLCWFLQGLGPHMRKACATDFEGKEWKSLEACIEFALGQETRWAIAKISTPKFHSRYKTNIAAVSTGRVQKVNGRGGAQRPPTGAGGSNWHQAKKPRADYACHTCRAECGTQEGLWEHLVARCPALPGHKTQYVPARALALGRERNWRIGTNVQATNLDDKSGKGKGSATTSRG